MFFLPILLFTSVDKINSVLSHSFFSFHSQQAQALDRDILPWSDYREHGDGAAGPSTGRTGQGRSGSLCW